MFVIPLKSNSYKHIFHTNYRFLIFDNDKFEIIDLEDVKDILEKNDLIYTIRKIDLNVLTNSLYSDKIFDINLFLWLLEKKDCYSTNFKKYIVFYNNNEYALTDIKLYIFFKECLEIVSNQEFINKRKYIKFYNDKVLSVLSKFNSFIYLLDSTKLLKMNKLDDIIKNIDYSGNKIWLPNNYDYHTLTLRPTNTLYHFNFMNIPKEDRDVFNFENKYIAEIDFKSFHFQILAKYLKIELPEDYNSWHEYFWNEYFKSKISDFQNFKKFIFHLLYSKESENQRDTYNIEFFDRLRYLKQELKNNFVGYIATSKIINYVGYELSENQIFNYFIQLSEVELMFTLLYYIINELKINVFYYLYDSFYFIPKENSDIQKVIDYIKSKNLKFELNIYKNNLKNKINSKTY